MTSLTFPRNAFQRAISKGTSSLRTFPPLGCINKSERSYNTIHFQRQFPPDVPAPGTEALYQMWSLGAEVRRRAWRAQLQVTRSSAQFGEWMSSLGKGKKKCHFSFFLFEVTKLQGSGGDCCSDFILWEAGGCLPEAAARRVICIACPLWFWRGALPSLRPSASLESGPLPHTDCIRPLIFSPPLPLPDLYSMQFNKLPRQVPRTHPNHFESQLADKRGIISYTPGGWVLERGPLGDTPGSPCVSPSLSPFTPRSWHLVAGTSAGSDLLKQLRLLNFQLALTNLMGPWESSFPEGEANSLLCLGTFLKFHQGDAGAKRDGELVLWYGEACLQYNEAPLFFWRVQGKESREEWDREVA